MEPDDAEIHDLLAGGLPLDRVGHRLRNAARRALLSRDSERMRTVARVITAELKRRGDLPPAPSPDQGIPNGLDHTLEAMQMAQDLRVGGPDGGDVAGVLEAALALLQKFTPEADLKILLFDEFEKGAPSPRVHGLDRKRPYPSWIDDRAAGFSVSLPSADGLPPVLTAGAGDGSPFTSAVAVPLFAPVRKNPGPAGPREAGLLFLLARGGLAEESSLRLGAKLSRFVTRRWQVHQDVNRMIHVDALTGLFNRGFLDAHLPLLLERAHRGQAPLSLVIADIDLFKSINSQYGLLVGDQVLQMVARRLKENVRKVDVVCRRGGEEFAIILPEADHQAVREVITRLLNATFRLDTTVEGAPQGIGVRLSYGVSIFPENGANGEQLHNQAEYLMLLSKDRGRNRCHYWRQDGHHLLQLPSPRPGERRDSASG